MYIDDEEERVQKLNTYHRLAAERAVTMVRGTSYCDTCTLIFIFLTIDEIIYFGCILGLTNIQPNYY
jgi:hypothetical protein